MKRIFWYAIVSTFVILSITLLACSSKSTSTGATQPATTKTSAVMTTTPTSTPAPISTAKNWWDKLGEPKYGGTLTIKGNFGLAATSFDPNVVMGPQAHQWEYDTIFMNDWTVDRNVWSFKPGFVPYEYIKGCLAENWEQVSPTLVKVNLRQGIHWQNKAPVNGRELTAEDVQYSCDRQLGTGSGFTKPALMAGMSFPNIEKVVATGKYTLEIYFNKSSALNLLQLISIPPICAKEWVEQGDLQNWKNAVGSGPWLVNDYVPGTSLTFVKNQNYWGNDERYVKNKIPYLDQLKVMEIPDPATALAAFRSNQIEFCSISIQQSLQLAKSNPDVVIDYWPGPANNIVMRCDNAPFTDINVRKALQMSIDRELIAKNLYGGIPDPTACGLMSPLLKGWAYSSDQWSDELKKEYSYNPERAKELLAQAGYPNGFKTNIVVSATQDAEMIQTIKAYLNEIKVDAEIKVLAATAFEAFQNDRKHDQMTIETKAGAPGGPEMQLNLRWSKGVQNYANVNDAGYDTLMEKMQAATSMDELKKTCTAMDKYALEHHWSVSTFGSVDPVALQPWVKGFSGELMILGTAPGMNFARWWITK